MRTFALSPRALAIAAAVVVTVALLGCGGDDDGTTTGTTATSAPGTATGVQDTTATGETTIGKQSTTTTGSIGKGGSKVVPVTRGLRGKLKGGEKQRDVLEVASDDLIGLAAKIENASKRPRVKIVIPRGPASEVTLELGPLKGEPVSSLTLRSKKGEFEANRVRWVCALPPNTFCPVQTIESEKAYELRMVAGKNGVIAFKVDLKPEGKPPSAHEKQGA